MNFYEHLSNFLMAVETDTARADSITEIKVKSDLFFKIANQMLRDTQDRAGFINAMSRDLSNVREYKLSTNICDVKIVRDVQEEILEKELQIEKLAREIEDLKNE